MSRRSESDDARIVELALRMSDVLSTLFAIRDGDDPAEAARSADTITRVAERDASMVLPYRAFVVRGIDSPVKQVRWESMATLALLAAIDASVVEPLAPRLREVIEQDDSVIARDKAIDAIAAYGRSSADAAAQTVPILEAALNRWNGKHVARILRALCDLAAVAPDLHDQFHLLAIRYADSSRPSVKSAARNLLAATEG